MAGDLGGARRAWRGSWTDAGRRDEPGRLGDALRRARGRARASGTVGGTPSPPASRPPRRLRARLATRRSPLRSGSAAATHLRSAAELRSSARPARERRARRYVCGWAAGSSRRACSGSEGNIRGPHGRGRTPGSSSCGRDRHLRARAQPSPGAAARDLPAACGFARSAAATTRPRARPTTRPSWLLRDETRWSRQHSSVWRA